MTGGVGKQDVEATISRTGGGNDVAAEVFGGDDPVAQARILLSDTMQLLFHQAESQLLFRLRLVVVILQLPGVIPQLALGLLAFGDVAYDTDQHALAIQDDLADRDGGGEIMAVLVRRNDFAFLSDDA